MCVFCQIIKGEIPSYKVYENDKVYAFLDIKPVRPGHVLVIPKNHSANIEEAEAEDLKALAEGVKEVGKILKEKFPCPAYNIILNNGGEAGQEVSHIHFHLIPRFENDGLKLFPEKEEYKEGEAEEIANKLTS